MKSILTIFTVLFAASALFLAGCAGTASSGTQSATAITSTPTSTLTTTSTSIQQADDILPTPNGYAYRGNINDPYPAIQVTEVILSGGHVTYRANIQTASGQTRHNIVAVNPTYNGIPATPAQISVNLSMNSVPAGTGITVTIGDQWSGPFMQQTILNIMIALAVTPGDYTFNIRVEVNGQSWGTVPCTLHVTA